MEVVLQCQSYVGKKKLVNCFGRKYGWKILFVTIFETSKGVENITLLNYMGHLTFYFVPPAVQWMCLTSGSEIQWLK
jgi:hypothetical protein